MAADAIDRGALSGTVPNDYLTRFERLVSDGCGVAHGVATTSGTTALALAVSALEIGPGDEVLVPALTNIATALAVVHAGATPVFVDSEPSTGNMDPAEIGRRITPRTRAVMPVHLFGHPVDMDPVVHIARERGLYVIEDAAQAQGARHRDRPVGGLGDVGCFSFYANKTITTGEGGMLVTRSGAIAERARSLRNLGYSGPDKFVHEVAGFNYRMSNLHAAIGVAQMDRLDAIVARKRAVARAYGTRLAGLPGLQLPVEHPWAFSTSWMYGVVLADGVPDRDVVRGALAAAGIETRAYFHPLHLQPVFQRRGIGDAAGTRPVAERLGRQGLYLPSSPTLSEADIDEVCRALVGAIRGA